MTNEQYLFFRGWQKLNGSFIDSDDKWYDPFDIKYDSFGVPHKNSVSSINDAVKIQLDRDAQIRDFVDLHRPKLLESK